MSKPDSTHTIDRNATGFARTTKRRTGRVLVLGAFVLIVGIANLPRLQSDPDRYPITTASRADEARAKLLAAGQKGKPDTIYRLREGVERFLITDINNPGASTASQSSLAGQRREPGIAPPPVTASAPAQEAWRFQAMNPYHREGYDVIKENGFLEAATAPLSTFSIDVDTASYANVRRMLRDGMLPPKDAVRVEEFINYFTYDYPNPDGEAPFSVNVEMGQAPWQPEHRLVRIGLRGFSIPNDERPPVNLVFLIDVSGSMSSHDKLPLVKSALLRLVDQLGPADRVGIVVYAGAAGQVLAPTPGDRRGVIRSAIERLESGGSTNGGQGIRLAYDMAGSHYGKDSINRVILATDGDFNVGTTDRGSLTEYVATRAKEGIELTALGFGTGNLQDGRLEQLANKGNGFYAYIDTQREADRVFVERLTGSLYAIAKDVKIQVEFNPAKVHSYRLIGYENRMLAAEDFNDDMKDAGEIGAGHTVTALYEVVPADADTAKSRIDPLRYVKAAFGRETSNDEMLFVKLRYKHLKENRSRRLEHLVADDARDLEASTDDFRFAAAVALFGMVLRRSPHCADATYEDVLTLARSGLGATPSESRLEFLELVQQAAGLAGRDGAVEENVRRFLTPN